MKEEIQQSDYLSDGIVQTAEPAKYKRAVIVDVDELPPANRPHVAIEDNMDNQLAPVQPLTPEEEHTRMLLSKLPSLELTEAEQQVLFDQTISKIINYQHQMEDVAKVAAGLIKEFRNRYNWVLECNRAFLKDFAIAHLKRDKSTGEIKGKSYKSLTAGGGVFFRAKPAKFAVNVTQDQLAQLYELLDETNPTLVKDCIRQSITYEITSPELLRKLLAGGEYIQDKDADMEIDPSEFGIEFIKESADPFYYCSVGSDKAWSSLKSKQLLTAALDNTDIEDDTKQLEVDDDGSAGILTTEDG